MKAPFSKRQFRKGAAATSLISERNGLQNGQISKSLLCCVFCYYCPQKLLLSRPLQFSFIHYFHQNFQYSFYMCLHISTCFIHYFPQKLVYYFHASVSSIIFTKTSSTHSTSVYTFPHVSSIIFLRNYYFLHPNPPRG